MKTDGQLYEPRHKGEVLPPPSLEDCAKQTPVQKKRGMHSEELLIAGLILLLVSDKCETDLPLVIALVYVLFWK